MRSTQVALALLAPLAAAALALVARAEPDPAAKVGAAAPEFKLKDATGKERSLSEFKGKVVVLEWLNHGCPFVKKHYGAGNMQKLQGDAAAKGVVWLSICSSAPGKQGHMSPEDHAKTAAGHKAAPAAILIDESGDVGRLYGAKTTPHMYVIDKEGVLRYGGAIDSISSSKADDIGKAENYVTAAVGALLDGKPVATAESKPYGCSVKY